MNSRGLNDSCLVAEKDHAETPRDINFVLIFRRDATNQTFDTLSTPTV